MIGPVCPFEQLMRNRLLLARRVQMTGHHTGRTKGAAHMGTPFITAWSCYIYIYRGRDRENANSAFSWKEASEDSRGDRKCRSLFCSQPQNDFPSALIPFLFKINSSKRPCVPSANKDAHNDNYIICFLFKTAATKTHGIANTEAAPQKSKSMPALMTARERSHKLICEEGTGQKHN